MGQCLNLHTPQLLLSPSGVVLIGVLLIARAQSGLAEQPAPEPPQAGPEAPAVQAETVTLNFPESVPLKTLADYVSQRLNVNFLYDDQVAAKKITIKAPGQVPVASLMGVLESALKMNGLVLLDAEEKGWKKIVPAANLAAIAQAGDGKGLGASAALTRVFALKHIQAARADQAIKPFLTQPGGNSQAMPEYELLIVSDFATNVSRVEALIEMLDRPGPELVTEFMAVKHLEAQGLAQQVTQLLAAQVKAQGQAAGRADAGVEVMHDARTNQLVLIGRPVAVAEAGALARSLDVELGMETRVYAFGSASPQRVDTLVKELIGELAAKRLYKSAVDSEANLLIVTATPDIHKQLAALQSDLDRPITEQQSPVRFYKLENATAVEVLETLRSMEGEVGLEGVNVEGLGATGTTTPALPGRNAPPATPGRPLPTPPVYRAGESDGGTTGLASMPRAIQTGKARVMADVNMNTIIVIAEPQEQRVYEQLIKRLDRRRPQVLIEATIVTLDTSGGFSLGVEISKSGRFEDKGRTLSFSSFGLSEVDPDTGSLTLTPGLGFNGALVSADIADVVLRALKTSGKASVISAPKILVNDNATGTLSSANEAPFISVNASDTVATTSFAGYEKAGTTLKVTPQISQGEHLKLKYNLELSSFSGSGSESSPPPRQTNTVESEITVPDGQTIIIGGLNRRDRQETIQRLPIVGQIPILEYLASNRQSNELESTLFVFIRPVILRDDQFHDLKYYSNRDLAQADMRGNEPVSAPLAMP